MKALRIDIAEEARALFSGLGVQTLAVAGLRRADLKAALPAARADAVARMRGITDYDDVTAQPEVQAWRAAYAAMRLRPGAYRSSLEALMRAWTAGRIPGSGLALVDLYNLVSIASAAPLGAVDRARLPAECLTLRFARPGQDRFRPIGGSVKVDPRAQAVSYCAEDAIVCYALNHRDSLDYGLDADSEEAVFLAEWTSDEQRRRATEALKALADLLGHAGASIVGSDRFGWAS